MKSPWDLGTNLRLAAAALALIFLAAFLGSFGAPSGNAPPAPPLGWLRDPALALLGLVNSIILFVVGTLRSAVNRESES